MIKMSKKGNKGVGWEEEEAAAGKHEVEEGWVRSDNPRGAQAVNLQGVHILCQSHCEVTLGLTDRLARNVVKVCCGQGFSGQETVGCRAVHLASFTITNVSDSALSLSCIPGFIKVIGNGRKPRNGQWSDTEKQGFLWQPPGSGQLVFTFHSKCFPWYIYTTTYFSGSDTKEQASQCHQCPFWQHSCHNTQSCTVIIQNLKNEMLLVTLLKMKLTVKQK